MTQGKLAPSEHFVVVVVVVVAQQSNSDLGRLIVEVSRLRAIRLTHTFPVVRF